MLILALRPVHAETGIAVFYGGGRTASGEVSGPNGLTAAHRTLPFGTKVLVTNVRNGRPSSFASTNAGHIDLSLAAARENIERLTAATVSNDLEPLLATVAPGQQVVYVRPITSIGTNWNAPWTELVRRRAAQWGAALSTDPRLVRVASAPQYYRPGASDIAEHAVVYVKKS